MDVEGGGVVSIIETLPKRREREIEAERVNQERKKEPLMASFT